MVTMSRRPIEIIKILKESNNYHEKGDQKLFRKK
jgi:hypothetical protein